jgi:hypothetical protein
MIAFWNNGLIDLDAVRTMGVSVKNPGSFGRFGTGIKYGIATVLRGGGSITLQRGMDTHQFTTETREIRGEPFDLVLLDGREMGITTRLGRDWEPWMVLREFGCNARDEGGDFGKFAEVQRDDFTQLLVEWDALDAAYEDRTSLFVEGEPLWADDALRILPGPSEYMFYRGVRARKLPKPSVHTYDILVEQKLTEDRTMGYTWEQDTQIVMALTSRVDSYAVVRAAVVGRGERLERGLAYVSAGDPSRTMLDVLGAARQAKEDIAPSAFDLMLKHMRRAAPPEGHYVPAENNDALSLALEVLGGLGIEFDEDQAFILVDELTDGVDLLVEESRVYIRRGFEDGEPRKVCMALLGAWTDLKSTYHTSDDMRDLLGPLLLNQSDDLRRIEEGSDRLEIVLTHRDTGELVTV